MKKNLQTSIGNLFFNSTLCVLCILLVFTNGNLKAQTPIGASPYAVPSSGNYTIPNGITNITVQVWGGGGGGGGTSDGLTGTRRGRVLHSSWE